MRAVALFLLVIFAISGCGSVKYNSTYTLRDNSKIERLSNLLVDTGGESQEAKELATLAIRHSKELANRYKLASPPQYHNFLVNSGQRSRGLCFHFVEDLMSEINSRDFKSFDFKWGRANADKLDEHNVIVVIKKGSSDFTNGVILDAWRNSGDLLFLKVKDDKKYKFKEWKEGNSRIR